MEVKIDGLMYTFFAKTLIPWFQCSSFNNMFDLNDLVLHVNEWKEINESEMKSTL